jgi:P4 family phage/plasmid primase-like protien
MNNNINYREEIEKRLKPAQIKNLKESCLSDETIYKAGYKDGTLYDRPGILIPFRNPLTNEKWFDRIRLDKALLDDDGKPLRYLQPKGIGVQPYLSSQNSDEKWKDIFEALHIVRIITEGEKKTDCLLQYLPNDYSAAGITGVYCWTNGDGELNEFIDQNIVINGTEVIIIPDSDYKTNLNVKEAILKLAKASKDKGAKVSILPSPGDPDNPGTKLGIDDWLYRHKEDERRTALKNLLERRQDLTKTRIKEQLDKLSKSRKKENKEKQIADYKKRKEEREQNNAEFNQKMSEAQANRSPDGNLTLDQIPIPDIDWSKDKDAVKALSGIMTLLHTFASTLEFRQEVIFQYKDSVYIPISEAEIRSQIVVIERHIKQEGISDRRTKVVKQTFDNSFHRNIEWRKQLSQYDIPLQDYIWDCANDESRPYSKDIYIQSKVKVSFYPEKTYETPNWDKYILQTFCTNSDGKYDEEKEKLIHEAVGFYLTQRALIKTLFVIIGATNTGKSVFGKLLSKFIGDEFCTSIKFCGLNDQFGKEVLPGKLLAIDSEPCGEKGNNKISGAALKEITSGEDPILINTKSIQHKSVLLQTKFLVLANEKEMPQIDDKSGVASKRIIFFKIEQPTPERLVPNLSELIWNEREGIVNKCVKAFSVVAKRIKNGEQMCFTMPKSSIDAMFEYESGANPIPKFVKDTLDKVSSDEYISFDELYDRYLAWTKALKCKAMHQQSFAKGLRQNGFVTKEQRIPAQKDRKRSIISAGGVSQKKTILSGYRFKSKEDS